MRTTMLTIGLLSLSGCALLSKAEPLEVRYFAPPVEPGQHAAVPEEELKLKLGRIEAAPYLDRRIVYRDADEELGYWPTLRWTETPDAYLRRALSQELFETRGITRVVSGRAPTLDVELVAFEEVTAPSHVARMTVAVSLVDGKTASFARTFTIERPIAATDDPRATVDALSQAIEASVALIAQDVVPRLPALEAPPPREERLSLDP